MEKARPSLGDHTPMENASLHPMETLITEFFSIATSNERKKQIDASLTDFSNQPDSWKVCLAYFHHTNSEYTKMFCLNVIETFVTQRWLCQQLDVRIEFRTTLWKFLIDNHYLLTTPLKNKLCKIMIMIARFDWPDHYDDFMDNLLDLLMPEKVMQHSLQHSSALLSLGLTLLSTLVEELCPNGRTMRCVSSERQLELTKLVIDNVPSMLRCLSLLLELILSKHVNFISATPPPSPSASPTRSTSGSMCNETLINLFQNGMKKGFLKSIPDMDLDSIHMTSQIFACFTQIISFMPVNSFVTIDSTLLSGLYVFATFGSVNPSYRSARLGIDAMSCINEMFSKTAAFSSEANELIYSVFQNVSIIMERMMNGSPRTSPSHNGEYGDHLDDIDEVYLTKFITFLKLFIVNHLARFEKLIEFGTKEMLSSMYVLTTKVQHSVECYSQMLEVWTIYLEYLQSTLQVKHKENTTMSTDKLHTIKEPIFALLVFLLKSIQFGANRQFLEQLDDDCLDEDNQTELEHYIHNSIEVIANIGEVYPPETIHYIDVNCVHDKLSCIQYGLEFYTTKTDCSTTRLLKNGTNLLPKEMQQHPLAQLQINLLDFITSLQVCSRFSIFFVQESFDSHFMRTKSIFDKLFSILQFMHANGLCEASKKRVFLLSEFILLKAQIIATFKAYIVWFQQFCLIRDNNNLKSDSHEDGLNKQAEAHITAIVQTCCDIVCDAGHGGVDNVAPNVRKALCKLYHSGALTLYTFSFNVRPPFGFNLAGVQRLLEVSSLDGLLQLGGKLSPPVPLADQVLVSQSIVNFLVLPWFSLPVESQDWERRSLCLNHVIGHYLQLFNRLDIESMSSKSTSNQPLNHFCRSLYILRKVIKSHADSPGKSKQMLLVSLSTSLQAFTQLLMSNRLLHTTDVGCQITEHILALFIVVFDVLHAQVSIDLVRQTIQTLLEIINWHDILNVDQSRLSTAKQDVSSAFKVIIKFMKMLTLIVKQTSNNSTLKSLLPEMINFAVVTIHNNLIASVCLSNQVHQCGKAYDVYLKLLKVYYRFYYELLLNNNRYFFPKSSLVTVPSNAGAVEHFQRIVDIVGESFQRVDNIELYQQNVEALESLNTIVRLYWRDTFKRVFLTRYLYVFVTTLLQDSIPLLEESLYKIVFHLAEVDFNHFYNVFLPQLLADISGLSVQRRAELLSSVRVTSARVSVTGASQLDIDLPSFCSHLARFLRDIRYSSKYAHSHSNSL